MGTQSVEVPSLLTQQMPWLPGHLGESGRCCHLLPELWEGREVGATRPGGSQITEAGGLCDASQCGWNWTPCPVVRTPCDSPGCVLEQRIFVVCLLL